MTTSCEPDKKITIILIWPGFQDFQFNKVFITIICFFFLKARVFKLMHGKIRFPESAIESLDSTGFQCTHQFANCLQLVLNKSMMLSFCHEKNFKIRQNFACKDTFWTADSSTLFLHLTYTCNNLVICRFVYGSMVQHGCWPVMNIFMAFIVDIHA